MADDDVLQKLAHLTSRQREILKGVCEGNDYKTIAEEFVISEETVKSHVGNIYDKLGLDQMPVALRKKAIFEIYCPALHEEQFPPGKEEPTDPEPVASSIQKMVDEDEYLLLTPTKSEVIHIPPPLPKPPIKRRIWPRIILLVLVISLVILGGFKVYDWVNGLLHPISLNPTPSQVQVYVVVTATPQPLKNTPIPAPTNTESPSATSIPPTSTLPPPTFTPTIGPVITLPFEDNFDNGASPLWQTQSGTWLVTNGKYTVLPKEENVSYFDFNLLPSLPINDYRVSANVYLDGAIGYGRIMAILFRIPSDNSNYLSLYMEDNDTRFAVIGQDYDHVETIAEDKNYVVPSGAKVTVDVQGNTFTAIVNGKEIMKITMSGYETGGVGLMDICFSSPPCPSFDNFSIEPLP